LQELIESSESKELRKTIKENQELREKDHTSRTNKMSRPSEIRKWNSRKNNGIYLSVSLMVALCYRSSNREFILSPFSLPIFRRLVWLSQASHLSIKEEEEKKKEKKDIVSGKCLQQLVHMAPDLEQLRRIVNIEKVVNVDRISKTINLLKQRVSVFSGNDQSSIDSTPSDKKSKNEMLKKILWTSGVVCMDVIMIILDYRGTDNTDEFTCKLFL
jgi:hypothetical protein